MSRNWHGLELDTIFVGDWSRAGKLHTIENLVRVVSLAWLVYGDKYFLPVTVPMIIVNGLTLRDEDGKSVLVKLW